MLSILICFEIEVWNFRTLKNKYDLTLCQSCLHTASETFVRQKKIGSGLIFCVFASVACILIGKNEEKRKRKFRTQCVMTFTLVYTVSHDPSEIILICWLDA